MLRQLYHVIIEFLLNNQKYITFNNQVGKIFKFIAHQKVPSADHPTE